MPTVPDSCDDDDDDAEDSWTVQPSSNVTSNLTKKTFQISGEGVKDRENINISEKEVPVPVQPQETDGQVDNEEMKEFKEKKRLMSALAECDQRLESLEASLLNLRNGKVLF